MFIRLEYNQYMKPLLSILMPAYNHEKYISQAIESALAQKTSFNYEIIINDDCSTDKTYFIAQEYAKKYPDKIILIRSPENQGLMKSYKNLLNKAQGKYISFLETDDYFIDELKSQKSIDFLEHNPDYGIVGGAYLKVDANNNILGNNDSDFDVDPDWYPKLLCRNRLAGVLTICFVKEYFDKICNIDEFISLGFKTFDYPTWLLLTANYKGKYFHYDGKFFGAYRILSSSISNTTNYNKRKNFEDNITTIQEYIINKCGFRNTDKFEYEECQNKRYLLLALHFRNLKDYLYYAHKIKSHETKYKIMHYFPLLWYLQHIVRIKKEFL